MFKIEISKNIHRIFEKTAEYKPDKFARVNAVIVTTLIQCKNDTSVKRRHIQYNICDDTLAVRYSADIVPEKKSHK